MEITTRAMWTLLHGMGFGALYLLACSGVLVELWRRYSPNSTGEATLNDERFLKRYLVAMSLVAWFTVLSGAYVIYPWYRATPPIGTTDLAGFPQLLLKSNPATAGWHTLGMEWKEHVAWITPISITMACAVFIKYGRRLKDHPELSTAVLWFTAVSFIAAGVAAFFGAMLDKYAPVSGGVLIHLYHGG
jgi:hypothetical protein